MIIQFKNQPELHVELRHHAVVEQWQKLFVDNYSREFPIFRDERKYSIAYLNELVAEANDKLGWQFNDTIASVADTTRLHKHIEQTLANGFDSIPAEFDNLLHELHFCLHKVEFMDIDCSNLNKRFHLQIEWFNDEGFALDESFDHKLFMEFGDIKIQNPYVGHIPLLAYQQNDHANILQTCRFHDFVKPGIYIETREDDGYNDFAISAYINWWASNAPEFLALHGLEKLLHYTGQPVIGRVVNLDDLRTVVNSDSILELERVTF